MPKVTACSRSRAAAAADVYPTAAAPNQSFDQVGAIAHLSKWSKAVVRSTGRELAAHGTAPLLRGPPGVVHLDVPETVMNGKVKADVPIWQPHQYRRVDAIVPRRRIEARPRCWWPQNCRSSTAAAA